MFSFVMLMEKTVDGKTLLYCLEMRQEAFIRARAFFGIMRYNFIDLSHSETWLQIEVTREILQVPDILQ